MKSHLGGPEQVVTLGNGAPVRLRPIRPDDEPRLMALCDRLSPRTLYQRFFSVRRLRPEEAFSELAAHLASNGVDYGTQIDPVLNMIRERQMQQRYQIPL